MHWRRIGNVLDRPGQLPLPPEVPASGGIYAPTIRHHDGRFHEPAPHNPVLTHSGSRELIQCTGHADLVQAADGSWWMVLLGTRPRGFFPECHVLGRETFLAPVEWADGWLRAGPVRERHPAPAAWEPAAEAEAADPARDDFDGAALAPYWISPHGRPEGSWSPTERPGRLALTATGDSLDRPGHTFVGRRQQHHDCRAAVRLDPGPGGPGSRSGWTRPITTTSRSPGERRVIARIGPVRQCLAERPVPPGPVTLAVDIRTTDVRPPTAVRPGEETAGVRAGGPDTLVFSVEGPGGGRDRLRWGPGAGLGEAPLEGRGADPDGGVVTRADSASGADPGGGPAEGPGGEPGGSSGGGPGRGPGRGSGDVVRLAELDGRYLSTEVAGGFTCRVIGRYVTEGRAAFDWFAYEARA